MHSEIERRLREVGIATFSSRVLNGECTADLWDMKHPSGTTRMSEDPRRGVVDRDCRVHGVTNLYVVGSSTFPTVGYANPTFLIVALALRLADRLRDEVR
jgi:choline dehydrogenase-like flavoprotein